MASHDQRFIDNYAETWKMLGKQLPYLTFL